MEFVRFVSWLWLVLVCLWIVLTWIVFEKEPSTLLLFFTVMQFLALHSIPPWPKRQESRCPPAC